MAPDVFLSYFKSCITDEADRLTKQIWLSPKSIEIALADHAFKQKSNFGVKFRVSGETDNISIYAIGNNLIIVYIPFGKVEENIVLQQTASIPVSLEEPHLGIYVCTPELMKRLRLPQVMLINPAVKDVFPTPRLALSISALAGYLRKYQLADVTIFDLQLSNTTTAILQALNNSWPDIIGISISFGQLQVAKDILRKVFSAIEEANRNSIVVAGNVISSLAYEDLLKEFPKLIICNGEGELSIARLVRTLPTMELHGVPGITYINQGKLTVNQPSGPDMDDLPLPSLDTAPEIIEAGGAVTLEISRGCSHSACTFCPRTHKPKRWKGTSPKNVIRQLEHLTYFFNQFQCERRLFMADEEFIGWMKNAGETTRIATIMDEIKKRKIKINFDTNTRVDQIYNPDRDTQWHIDRMNMLLRCRDSGMDRLLLGVESGSDSVLKRFNKNISSYDSVIALRILSALGINMRITFITFDPLMTITELRENIDFLSRDDFYLNPVNLNTFTLDELFKAVSDDEFVSTHSQHAPFYEHVSYMLVKLDVLANCHYIHLLREEEKTSGKMLFLDDARLDKNMARYKTSYKDDRIGIIAHCCQLWIDKHFAVDYALKGMFKTANSKERNCLFTFRKNYRKLSLNLLQSMTWFISDNVANKEGLKIEDSMLKENIASLKGSKFNESFVILILDIFNEPMVKLINSIDSSIDNGYITDSHQILRNAIERWRKQKSWSLINP